MMMIARRAIDIAALLCVAAIGATGMYHVVNRLKDVPPVRYLDARGPDEPVEPGERVLIEYRQERNRPCPADIYAWWVRTDTETADVRLPMVHGGYSRAADKPYWQPVVVTAPNVPGEYEYRANLIHFCESRGNGPAQTYVTVPPPVRVVVE